MGGLKDFKVTLKNLDGTETIVSSVEEVHLPTLPKNIDGIFWVKPLTMEFVESEPDQTRKVLQEWSNLIREKQEELEALSWYEDFWWDAIGEFKFDLPEEVTSDTYSVEFRYDFWEEKE